MRLHCCWLLAACITAINALTVTYPPPNSTIGVGSMFYVIWDFNQTVSSTLLVTISLLSSPSSQDIVAALATTEEENGSQMIVVNHAQPNTIYYLSLNDTNSPTVVAGPYYFSNSSNLSIPPQPISPSNPSNESTNTPFSSSYSSKHRYLPLIYSMCAIAGLLFLCFVSLKTGLYAAFRKKIRPSADSSDSRLPNESNINQEQSQMTEVDHTSNEHLTSEEQQVQSAEVNTLVTPNSTLTASHIESASAHSTDDNAYLRAL